ncbi:HK97-gp10 family putative phage morphogenesis protein [Kaistia defluvii]|uniref:HK97 gp10 family phage protein n=1 Tax=Kaistia defluvii TaxID=410841 RepID=A0ABV2R126_9HYPH
MAKTTVKVEGLRELEAALSDLPKAVARNTLRRVLKKAGEPIADKARQLAPVKSGKLRDSIVVSPKLGTKAGQKEFAAAMEAGLGKEAAVGAMRDARRAAKGEGSFAEMYVGPGRQPHAHLQEFGSVNNRPHPYMRPAWDAHKDEALDIIKGDLGGEIMKAAKRVAKRKAKLAAKGG